MSKYCDIIIPIWNQVAATRNCIEGIDRNTKYPYRLILIDNGSEFETKEYLKNLKNSSRCEVELITNEKNLGFVKAVNQGLRASRAPYVCIVNNDIIPAPGWLEQLVQFAEGHDNIGMMNPMEDDNPDTSFEESAQKTAQNKGSYFEMNQCFLYATLIKREVIDKVGYLDEDFGMGCYEDADYGMRVSRAGYQCAHVYSSCIYHKHAVSFRVLGNFAARVALNERIFTSKWGRTVRAGAAFVITENTSDEEIEYFMKIMLRLAREWCWIDVWIFGNKNRNKVRVALVSDKAGIPRHQNIKLHFFSNRFKYSQLLIRIGERLFGTKKRKKYDIILMNNKFDLDLLKRLYGLFHIQDCFVNSKNNNIQYLSDFVFQRRKRK